MPDMEDAQEGKRPNGPPKTDFSTGVGSSAHGSCACCRMMDATRQEQDGEVAVQFSASSILQSSTPDKPVLDDGLDLLSAGGYQFTPVGLSEAQVEGLHADTPQKLYDRLDQQREQDPRYMNLLDRVKRFDAREALANDAEAVVAQLDVIGVPRERDGQPLSLWGRIELYGEAKAILARDRI